MIYKREGHRHTLTIEPSAISDGIRIAVDSTGAFVPDDKIPDVISALQNYMSQKAKRITLAAKVAR